MPIEIVPFAAEHLPRVRDFARRVWRRPDDERFVRWRWVECPGHTAWLALRGTECVAILSATRRRYRLGERVVEILETFDWYTLPELVNSGLGIRVLRAAIETGTPMLAVGGTATTRRLLPRLGWRDQGEVTIFALPLDTGALATALRARARLPPALAAPLASLVQRVWLHPRSVRPPTGGEVVALPGQGELAELYAATLAQGTVRVFDAEEFEWLSAGGAPAGHYVSIAYRRRGRLAGIGIGRIYEEPEGREAAIVDLFSPSDEPALWTWMVAELVARLAAFSPRRVHASASWPVLAASLRRNRFVRVGAAPIRFRAPDASDLVAPVHLTACTGDAAFEPYSTGAVY